MRAYVYYNLHKKCWSLKNWKSKRVEKHAKRVVMINCEMKVSEAGRQRVLKEKRKNVHAGILGKVLSCTDAEQCRQLPEEFQQITYCPYKYKTFVTVNGVLPVYNAKCVFIQDGKVFAFGINHKEVK